MPYNIEKYWSKVAKEVKERKDNKFIACGKSDAYWEYQRDKFIESFRKIDMSEYFTILEVGCGPGGNLLELTQLGGRKIYGVDISK
jgi:SAM-dependent methyltransferase